MRTITNDYVTITCYDEGVYLQARNVMRVHVDAPEFRRVALCYADDVQGAMAVYTLDANNEVVIDVTDLLRVNAIGVQMGGVLRTLAVNVIDDAMITEVPAEVAGLIDPTHVYVPSSMLREKIVEETGNSKLLVVPPTMMYEALNVTTNTIAESNNMLSGAVGAFVADYREHLADGSEGVATRTDWAVTFDGEARSYDVYAHRVHPSATKTIVAGRRFAPKNCERKYVAVRWVSFTGVTRQHTFEMRNATTKASDRVELMTMTDGYNVLKGREDGFDIHLPMLDAYDYWYYSDVCTSSKVEVSMDGVTWEQVDVDTKAVRVPNDGAKNNDLTITIKWRHYDAYTM